MSDVAADDDVGEVDAATTEIVRSHLVTTANEMERALTRTAYNAIVYEVKDFAISLYDDAFDLLADSSGNNLFLGANDYGVVKAIEYVGVESLEPGDVVLSTYPYWSSRHPNDAVVIAPAFHEGEIVGYPVVRSHWIDIGQKDPGYVFDATDVHQEGLLLPGVKVHKAGVPDEELIDVVRFNTRSPKKVVGDLNAQIAAVETGTERLVGLHEKYGTPTVEAAIERVLAHSARKAREAVGDLPDGTWEAEDFLDTDGVTGDPVAVRARVTVDGEAFTVDFSPSPGAVAGPFNVPIGLTRSVCKLCLKAITLPEDATNSGHFDPLTVVAPEGTLFNAQYPAPTYSLATSIAAVDVVFKALAQGMPGRVPASSGGDICNLGTYGIDPESGEMVVEATNEAVGQGASAGQDGENALMHLAEATQRNLPVEVWETNVPVRIDRLELRPDSGGAGEYRGGLGVRRDYRALDTVSAKSFIFKTRTAGWAIAGGEPGDRNAIVLTPDPGDGDWRDRFAIYVDTTDTHPEAAEGEVFVGMFRGEFHAGEGFANRTGGGGGYGDPFDRDPEAVREDVLDGYVTREGARDDYGVVFTDDGTLDREATRALREDGG